jgi:hypothetical protein
MGKEVQQPKANVQELRLCYNFIQVELFIQSEHK